MKHDSLTAHPRDERDFPRSVLGGPSRPCRYLPQAVALPQMTVRGARLNFTIPFTIGSSLIFLVLLGEMIAVARDGRLS